MTASRSPSPTTSPYTIRCCPTGALPSSHYRFPYASLSASASPHTSCRRHFDSLALTQSPAVRYAVPSAVPQARACIEPYLALSRSESYFTYCRPPCFTFLSRCSLPRLATGFFEPLCLTPYSTTYRPCHHRRFWEFARQSPICYHDKPDKYSASTSFEDIKFHRRCCPQKVPA